MHSLEGRLVPQGYFRQGPDRFLSFCRKRMPLLIDGYNLLFQSGLLGKGRGPGALEQARGRLLRFLAAVLEPDELSQTTIVFDAGAAPPDMAAHQRLGGMTVLFARGYDSADELLIELIRSAPQPKQLTVVSSDHQIQRAARSRRAPCRDAAEWFEQLRDRRQEGPAPPDQPEKPADELNAEQLDYWRSFLELGESPD
jgi:hypothetical protein